MDIVFMLVPLSVVLVLAIVVVFWWSVNSGQFDDLERHGRSVVDDDDTPDGPAPRRPSGPGPSGPDPFGPGLHGPGLSSDAPPSAGPPASTRSPQSHRSQTP